MPRRRRATALLILLGLTAVACDLTRPVGGEEDPTPGGELVVSIRDLGTLDPARAGGRGALLVISQIFEPLTTIDPRTNEVRPGAAASWQLAGNGLTWVFRLHEGATFHDGSPVTAADFKRAFDRLARKRTQSDAAFQLEQVRGFRETHTLGTAPQLAGVRVRGDRRLDITLARPFAELPHALAHPALAPLHRKHTNGAGNLATAPVGNGPFKVVSATREEEAVLERDDAFEPTPLLDRVRFVVESDVDESWRRFRRDDFDVTDVPISSFQSARGTYDEAGFSPQWATLSFGPNLKLEKYAKPEVRRALSLAIDRDAIVSGVYANTKEPATGLLPLGVRGYVPDACGACARDVERATQLVRAAFGGNPPRIVVDHLNDPTSRSVSRAIATQLGEVGFEAVVRAHAPDAYLRLLRTGRHDLAQLGWLSDVPSPDGFLAQQLRTGSPNNQTGFSDQAFDRLIDAARRAADEDTRLTRYREAEARALELMPLIPVVFFRNRTAIAEDVRGLVVDGAGLFDAESVWLAR